MSGRRPRGKPGAPHADGAEEPPQDATAPIEMSPELLESMRDESERPTIRLPARPPFAFPEDEDEIAVDPGADNATVRRRVIVGPDGVARMLDVDELEVATRVFAPPTVLLSGGQGKKKKKR